MDDPGPEFEPPFSAVVPLFRRRRKSDAEYIETLRNSLCQSDRSRWALIALHLGIIGAVIWLGYNSVGTLQRLLANFPQQNPMPESIIITGLIIGSSLGFFLQSSLRSIVDVVSGSRTERLLVHYHDHIHSTQQLNTELNPESHSAT